MPKTCNLLGLLSVPEVTTTPAHSTLALVEEDSGEGDPWDMPELKDTGVSWSGKGSGVHTTRAA